MGADTNVKRNPVGYVKMIIQNLDKENQDTAFRAAMRKADNPNPRISCKSWEYISRYCNLDKDYELVPFALIGASMARLKQPPVSDGELGIGRAIAVYYSRGERNNNDDNGIDKAAKTKINRLLACDTASEACTILRPLLGLINSDVGNIHLNYTQLLWDLLKDDENFNEKVKPRWAMDFYHKKEEDK
ncbi:hypothetical protein FACS1894147_08080 [Spirochaetia bacterium]|nr:hypothetical protein FACS1894147_08080 [Spirochaetia bacterium]